MVSPFDKVLARLKGAKKNGAGVMALCPSHPDKNPSLHVTEKRDGTVLLKCFADCETEEIVEALGLKLADLFPPKKTASSAKEARDMKAKAYREQEAEARRAMDPEAFWRKASPATQHAYLKAKGVRAHGELRVRQGDLLVPVRDAGGDLINLQRISPGGEKRFLPGCPTEGGHYLIEGGETLLVCEGYATGATLAEETGATVAVAFSAGNVPAVARALSEKLDLVPVIATDADEAGLRAAREAGGVEFIPPDGEVAGEDWNDWARAHPGKLARRLRVVLRAAARDEPAEERDWKPRSRFFLLPDEMRRMPAHVDWLIDGYFEVGTMAQIVGRWGTGKTLVATDIFLSVCSDRDWCGRKTKHGPVVVLSGEAQRDQVRRTRAWAKHHGIRGEAFDALPFLITQMPVNLYDADEMREFFRDLDRHFVAKHGEPVLFVIDHQRGHLRGKENDSDDFTEFERVITEHLRKRYGMRPVIVVLHHPGYADELRGRGSSAQGGTFEFVYLLSRQGEGDEAPIVMRPDKQKGHLLQPPLVFGVAVMPKEESAVAVHDPGARPTSTRGLGKNQLAALAALPADRTPMLVSEWYAKAKPAMEDSARMTAAKKSLLRDGVIKIEDGHVSRA